VGSVARGFGLTYVAEGRFAHADSLGDNGQLYQGAAQVMGFGRDGALHSERNASPEEPVRFIQFWILPSDPILIDVPFEFEPVGVWAR
jgi:redox-sensitive bicupin YhaK (pirin superfamily)